MVWEPEAGSSNLEVGQAIEMLVFGWQIENGVYTPLRARNAVRMAVGKAYLTPVVNFERGGWSPLSSTTPIPTEDSRTETAACLAAQAVKHPLAAQIAGAPLCEIATTLDAAPRDQLVEQFRDLPPEERFRAVAEAQGM